MCWKASVRGDVTRIETLQFCSHISMKFFIQWQDLEHHIKCEFMNPNQSKSDCLSTLLTFFDKPLGKCAWRLP